MKKKNFTHFETMLHIFILHILIHTVQAEPNNLLVKGGLIFERIQEAPMNQDYVTFTRKLNMSTLEPLKGMLVGALNTYEQVCLKANSNTGPTRDVMVQFKPVTGSDGQPLPYHDMSTSVLFMAARTGTLRNSANICKRFGAKLPEIRYRAQTSKFQSFCNRAQITDILTSIKYDEALQVFQFGTDKDGMDAQPFPKVQVKTDNGSYFDLNWTGTIHRDYKPFINNKIVFYGNCKIDVQPYIKNVPYDKGPIICEYAREEAEAREVEEFQRAMFAWTQHNCKRDGDMLSRQVHQAIKEVDDITEQGALQNSNDLLKYTDFIPILATDSFRPSSFSLNIMSDEPSRENKTTLTVDEEFQKLYNTTPETMANEIKAQLNITDDIHEKDIEKFINGGGLKKFNKDPPVYDRQKRVIFLPFYQLVQSMATLRDILNPFQAMWRALKEEKLRPALPTLEQFKVITHEISTINFNQKNIKDAVLLTQAEVQRYNITRIQDFDAITSMAAELGIKGVITMGLQIIKQVMMKIANVLLAAMTGKTSVYALNQEELNSIIAAYKGKAADIQLSRELSDIRTSLIGKQSEVHLQFKIPIIRGEQQFEFYQ